MLQIGMRSMTSIRSRLTAAATRRTLHPPLAFMHVPKTAGTSVSGYIDAMLRPRHTIRPYDRLMFGSFNEFDSIAPDIRQRIVTTPDKLPSGADAIFGHIALSTILSRYPHAKLLTILREPRSRVLSLFLYWRSRSGDENVARYGGWGERIVISRRPLSDFLDHPEIACLTDNMLTRMLLWPHPQIPDAGFIDPRDDTDLLEAARAALDRFDFVDLVANPLLFKGMSLWLKQVYGSSFWATIRTAMAGGQPIRSNEARVGTAAPHMAIHPAVAESADLLKRATRLDHGLWKIVVRRRMSNENPTALAERTFATTLDRYGGLRRSNHAGV